MPETYVISGASRGIGLEFVRQLSEKGHTVFALARSPGTSEGLKALVDNKKVFAVKCDATYPESVLEAAKEVEKHAPEGIDVLINNAGITGDVKYNTENTPQSEYMNVFETNVVGVANVTQSFLPILRKRGQDAVKKILNISSLSGSIAATTSINKIGGFPAYSVSKAALNMLTKLDANRFVNENIIVQTAHPGSVLTDMNPKGAIQTAESVAGMLNVLDSLTSEQNGIFLDYEGKGIAW